MLIGFFGKREIVLGVRNVIVADSLISEDVGFIFAPDPDSGVLVEISLLHVDAFILRKIGWEL